VGEYGVQEGTKHAPLRGPSVEDQRARHVVTYPYHPPTLTTYPYHMPIRKSRIQREVFSPSVLSLVISFVGTMVLNCSQ
jgi:hypothetical protein